MKTLITASMLAVVVANTAQAQFRIRGTRPAGTQTFGHTAGGFHQQGRFGGTGRVSLPFGQGGLGQNTGFTGFGQQGFQGGGAGTFGGFTQQPACQSGTRGTSRPQRPRRPVRTRRPEGTQTGGNPWGERPVGGGQTDSSGGRPPATQQPGVPQKMQGVWFEISPEGNLWTYVIRANSYDMFEVDPRTNQQVVIDGQPVQVENGRLTFRNGVLHLSPGADAEEGPFNAQASSNGTRLTLSGTNGGTPRTLTRERQI